MLLAEEWALQRPQQAVGYPGSLWGIGRRQQDGELITAEPRHHVGDLQPLAESWPDLSQQDVTHLVTKAVVDLFEVVDVEQQERYRRLASACDRPIELLAQHQAVGEVGQAVVQRVVLERRLCETLPATKLRLFDGVLDRRSQPAEPVFQL